MAQIERRDFDTACLCRVKLENTLQNKTMRPRKRFTFGQRNFNESETVVLKDA